MGDGLPMMEIVDWRDLPFMAGNRLFLDYVEGTSSALSYYTWGPGDLVPALASRRGFPFPRALVSRLLVAYNQPLGASPSTLANIEALGRPDVYCVVGGQQAGFLGGPSYVAYKIACTIQLARELTRQLSVHVVPVFWLASEDHDFGEINHTHYVQRDGEIGRVSFDWTEKGRPIADLPLSDALRTTLETYWASVQGGPFADWAREATWPRQGRYCDWIASIWLNLFAEEGLVVVEPHVLRPAAGSLFRRALEHRAAIGERLHAVAESMRAKGYTPMLDAESAGVLYTFDESGRRVRVTDPQQAAPQAEMHPERFSTDAALRPLFADSVLPVLASTLGAGELAYQGMLRPLYELFGIPQPVCYPRASYTVLSEHQRDRLAAYRLQPRDVLTGELDIDRVMRNLMPPAELERFAQAQRGVEGALAPLEDYLEALDPNLLRSWEQALATAQRNIEKLEERAINATLARHGHSRRELQMLRNELVPRGRLQERVLPITHFLQRFGPGFLDQLKGWPVQPHFGHTILTLREEHG